MFTLYLGNDDAHSSSLIARVIKTKKARRRPPLLDDDVDALRVGRIDWGVTSGAYNIVLFSLSPRPTVFPLPQTAILGAYMSGRPPSLFSLFGRYRARLASLARNAQWNITMGPAYSLTLRETSQSERWIRLDCDASLFTSRPQPHV